MQTVIIGDKGTEWTENPRTLTDDEATQIKAMGRLEAVKMHRQITSSTLRAALNAVSALHSQ